MNKVNLKIEIVKDFDVISKEELTRVRVFSDQDICLSEFFI